MLSTLEAPTFVSEHQDNIMSNFLYRHCDERQLAVFGYIKDIPGVETLRALTRFDYRGCILTGGNTISDDIDDDIQQLLESEGLAAVGGYAVDSLPASHAEFKKMLNLIEDSPNVMFSNDFLVVAQVSSTRLYSEAAIKIAHEVNNFGSTVTSSIINHAHALEVFRKGWEANRLKSDKFVAINI